MTTDNHPLSPGENPLVSLILFAYRQEGLIRQAVEGALSQTYSPLEIILSDDGSPDGTFEIMREIADHYRGPHRIVLNRNPRNLGIGDHVQKAFSLASGQWFVTAAGDDISFPNRVEVLMHHVKANPRVRAIASGIQYIDENGAPLPDWIRPWNPAYTGRVPVRLMLKREGYFAHGCALAVHRSVWTDFPPLGPGFVAEDRLYPFRAALLGDLYQFRTKLVKYRLRNDGAPPTLEGIHQMGGTPPAENLYLRQQTSDVRHAAKQGWIPEEFAGSLIGELMRYAAYNRYEHLAREAGFPRRMVHDFRKLFHLSLRKDWRLVVVQKLFPKLAPFLFRGPFAEEWRVGG